MWLLHERLREDASPYSKRVAANRGEEHPYCRIYSPCEALRGVGAAFALDGVHDANHVVLGGCFGLEDVAVSKECDCVFVHLYDSVDEVVAICVEHERHCSFAQVLIFPRAEGHLVAQVNHERVHAVALDCEGYGLTFGDQRSDLLHHHSFLYC